MNKIPKRYWVYLALIVAQALTQISRIKSVDSASIVGVIADTIFAGAVLILIIEVILRYFERRKKKLVYDIRQKHEE